MIVRMNAPSRASILAKQKDGILLVHQDGVKPFSRTSQKVSIDLANETENRLLKSGKDMLNANIGKTFMPKSQTIATILKKSVPFLQKHIL